MVTARTGALISPYTACGKPVYNGRALWTGCGRQRSAHSVWGTQPEGNDARGCEGERDERWG